MIQEKFNKETGFLESYWEGEITRQEILEYLKRVRTNTEYPRELKSLSDVRNARFKLSLEDLSLIAMENKKSLSSYTWIRDAYVIDLMALAALSSMFQVLNAFNNYHFNSFSSHESAIKWLNKV